MSTNWKGEMMKFYTLGKRENPAILLSMDGGSLAVLRDGIHTDAGAGCGAGVKEFD